ncbi:hypothetical protein DXT99_23995 [Pontibacter diazotrophicus]|uniref:Type 1 periplasmic binding fold superfamily protein n=1 Tax=Pontibacter diazotrophicus TaxID=1400979 RepID=A0A3D8L2Z8_9BACT|nr:hypothetical protein [Pontibacter diazotrophicus]RDV11750.1 hypothetical protein DXT99_23995 [Pontibacter diazotrophicus]
MKNLFRPYLTALMMGSLLFASTSCEDDDPTPPVEEGELITTVTINLVPQGKGQNVTAVFSDPDGPGGTDATIQTLNLVPNAVYDATLTFSDDSQTPSEDITEEIEEEGDEHEVFYDALGGLNVTVNKTDMDSNNRPIGLEATVTTGEASTGTLRITLKHQPGLKGSTSNIAVGETDVEANFPTVIQE